MILFLEKDFVVSSTREVMLREMWNGMQHMAKGVEVYRWGSSALTRGDVALADRRISPTVPRCPALGDAGCAATQTTPQKACPTAARPSSRRRARTTRSGSRGATLETI